MVMFILMFCIGLIVLAPFSRKARHAFGAIVGAIFVAIVGWLIFVSGIVLTVCAVQGNCHILWE